MHHDGPDDRDASATVSRRRLAAAATGALLATSGCVLRPGEDSADDPIREGGPPERDGWQLRFEDQFDEGALDTARWSYGMGGGTKQCPPHDGPNHCWAADHAWVDAETDRLRLQASEETPAGDADYTFGAVCTEPAFQQTFGYFEASCRMPATDGTLPAFWLLSDFRRHRYRELTFEARGADDGEEIHFGHLLEGDDGEMYGPPAVEVGMGQFYADFETPLHETFHALGIEWAPEYVAYYVDGEEVGRTASPVIREQLPGAPMYPILNHGVFEAADWIGDPSDASFPSTHDVEWVRVWQHEDWA